MKSIKLNFSTMFALVFMIMISACKSSSGDKQAELDKQAEVDKQAEADKRADSLQQRLNEEDKQKKMIDGRDYISSFSSKLMNTVSPVSGKNLSSEIVNEESSYDNLTKTLSLVFTTSWDAIADFDPNSPYETHIYKGRVIFYGDGDIRLETISENEVFQRAIKANEVANNLDDLLNKLSSKKSEDQ